MGKNKEQEAAEYLKTQGYHIVTANFYSSSGEIDIVAREGGCLCFVEVKYRSGTVSGCPQEAVDARKMRRISRTAEYYCYKNKIDADTQIRFDVVSMTPQEIILIKNAFEYTV